MFFRENETVIYSPQTKNTNSMIPLKIQEFEKIALKIKSTLFLKSLLFAKSK